MICHGYVADVLKRLGVPLFDSIVAEYMDTCIELSEKWDDDSLISCEICGSKKEVFIQVCPIHFNQKGLFTKKKGMMLFYVISVCNRHVGNDWYSNRHRGLRAFNGLEQKIVVAKFKEYTKMETSGIRHDISNRKKMQMRFKLREAFA